MIRKTITIPGCIILWLLMIPAAKAQQIPQKFIQETHYFLYLPDGYESDTVKRWPLVLFLHGSGESGSDLALVKKHGPPKLVDSGKRFPFLLVSPQSPVGSGWSVDQLYQLLLSLKKIHRVDANRIYLTGLSMGGFGSWELAMKHPEEFAAIAPVCGGGDTTNAWKLRNVPVWAFHGAKDDVVFPEASINMVAAAKRYNSEVKFTLYPEANHNSWDQTYTNDAVYQWLLSKKKYHYTEVPVNVPVLKQYEGKYVSAEGDTVSMKVENNELVARPGTDVVPLKPFGTDRFFIVPDKPMDIRFNRVKGKIISFVFLGDRKLLYRKVG